MKPIQGLVVDMDGVLWREQKLLPHVGDFFQSLRETEVPFVLATNNATQSFESVRERLLQAGVEVRPSEVLTSATGVAPFLRRAHPDLQSVYMIGAAALRQALEAHDFHVLADGEGAEAVVVGMDPELNWEKLSEATYAIRAGGLFIGTNPDKTFPTERGQGPGAGTILAALQAATDVEPTVFGKPEPHLFVEALSRLGCAADQALAVGDRLETDILGGQRAGLRTALLLTGVTGREDLEDAPIRPDHVFEDLLDLKRQLL